MFEQIENEIHSEEAFRELNMARAAIIYYQIVLKRMDLDDKAVKDAIEFCNFMKQVSLARRLRRMLDPVSVPYEEIMKGLTSSMPKSMNSRAGM